MARITGVGRERLRTWERRHGFPEPVRMPNGTRRYLASDVRRVVAAARAVESGMPVRDAIALATDPAAMPAAPSAAPMMDAALEHCDAPAIALAGPSPLRVVWANRLTVAAPEAPAVGDELLEAVPHFGSDAAARLQELMVEDGPSSVVVEHRDWTSTFPAERRSLAWRLPPEAAAEPTVVLMQLPAAGAAEDLPAAPVGAAWVSALSEARATLQEERGLATVQRSLSVLVRGTGGIDGFLATHQSGRMRTATSVAGSFPARVCSVAPGGELAAVLGGGQVTWLADAAAAALGAPTRSRTLVVPLAAGGDRIGAAFLLYPAELALDPMVRELLHAYGMALALTLQREHLAAAPAARAAAAAPSPAMRAAA